MALSAQTMNDFPQKFAAFAQKQKRPAYADLSNGVSIILPKEGFRALSLFV
jgi:hypothetical protein